MVNKLINYAEIPFLLFQPCTEGVHQGCMPWCASPRVLRRNQLCMNDKVAGVRRDLGCDNLPSPGCLHDLWAQGSRRLQHFAFRRRNTLWEYFVVILPHHRQKLKTINMVDWCFFLNNVKKTQNKTARRWSRHDFFHATLIIKMLEILSEETQGLACFFFPSQLSKLSLRSLPERSQPGDKLLQR